MDINRRDFVRVAGLGIAAGSTATAESSGDAAQTAARGRGPSPSRKAAMKVGTQHDSSDEVLGILAALGVNYICSGLPSASSTSNGPSRGSRVFASASNGSASRWTWCLCP